jgi:hypothetical protein
MISKRMVPYRPTRFLCSAKACLSLEVGLGGGFKGVEKHLPVDLVQPKGLVLLDDLIGCMQRLAEHEFRQALVCIGGSTL